MMRDQAGDLIEIWQMLVAKLGRVYPSSNPFT